MRRIFWLVVMLGAALGGCGDVEWFPEQGVTAFSFSPASVTGVPTNSVQTSDTVTLSIGAGASPAISVTGGEYSLNGAAFTTTAGTAKDGDTVAVRHTSADTPGETVTTQLRVGDKRADFSSTTGGFAEDVRFNVAPGSVQTSSEMVVAVQGESAPVSVTGGEYSINGETFTSAAGTVQNGDRVAVRHTAANGSSATAVTTTLSVGDNSFTFTTSTGPVLATTVNATGAPSSVVIAETKLRLVPGSRTITLVEGFGNFSTDGETFLEAPQTLNLTDGQTLYLSDISPDTRGSSARTTFLIDGVPLVFNVTAQ